MMAAFDDGEETRDCSEEFKAEFGKRAEELRIKKKENELREK
jgi:hypothetical protein